MFGHLIARLAATAGVIAGVASLVFLLLHLTPGDPVEAMLGESASAADRAELRTALGLDRPLLVQYLHYAAGLSRGDLGTSLQTRQPVSRLIAARLPA